MSPFVKYVLLQLPGWTAAVAVMAWLWSRGTVSGVVAVLAVGIWVVKDFVLYPWLRIAYEPPRPSGVEALIGETAIVRRRLTPTGMVRIRGEIWRAEAVDSEPVEAGTEVRVERAEGLRLFVREATNGNREGEAALRS